MAIHTPNTITPQTGPCGAARGAVDSSCAEVVRLAQAAVACQQRLREARQQLAEIRALRVEDARMRDRRELAAAKDAARLAYRSAIRRAHDQAVVQEAAYAWLRDIDRLNRQVELAERRADDVARRAAELEHGVPGIELAADAARIAAETAQAACLEARRALATCEEEAATAATNGRTAARTADSLAGPRAITLVLRGDQPTMLALALRLAEETGAEVGLLQLLLLELREAIAGLALNDLAFQFPARSPFWSQFGVPGAQEVAASLGAMGYRFDGQAGWVDDRAPNIRELAVALTHVGLDPRSLRRPASQEAVDMLWAGTRVMVDQYLAARAPGLQLEQVVACLGPRAARLAELWDMWGRLRPLLLAPVDEAVPAG